MKGIRALCFGLLLLFASGASAQLVEKVLDTCGTFKFFG